MFWRTSNKYQWIELCVATYNNTDIMNIFYQHKNICTHTWSANSSKTFIDYFVANRKLPEVFLDVRVYRGSDIGSDHFLTLDKLRFPPKWLYLPKNTACKEKYFIIKLDYSLMKVYNGYTNKDFNRNHKKFQKAAILFWDEGTSTP